MVVDPSRAYRQWAAGAEIAYNAQDAYCAGYEMGLRVAAERIVQATNPIVAVLTRIAEMRFP